MENTLKKLSQEELLYINGGGSFGEDVNCAELQALLDALASFRW